MNIYIIESPLQYINAISSKRNFNISIEKALLIVVQNNNTNNVKQLNYMLKNNIEKWNKIIYLSSSNSLIKLAKLRSILKKYDNIDRLFLGDYNNAILRDIANKVNYRQCILLDDGTASLAIYNKMVSKKFEMKKSNSKKLFKKILNIDTKQLKTSTFFTVFNDLKDTDSITIVHNDYSGFINELNTNKEEEYLLFLGSPYTEKKMMNQENYIEIMTLIKQYYGKEIVYIPHRAEDDLKLEQIQKIGFQIRKLNTSIEYEIILKNLSIPSKVLSFASSALINLKYLLEKNDVEIKALEIDINLFSEEHKKNIRNIYRYYEKHLKVIKI